MSLQNKNVNHFKFSVAQLFTITCQPYLQPKQAWLQCCNTFYEALNKQVAELCLCSEQTLLSLGGSDGSRLVFSGYDMNYQDIVKCNFHWMLSFGSLSGCDPFCFSSAPSNESHARETDQLLMRIAQQALHCHETKPF